MLYLPNVWKNTYILKGKHFHTEKFPNNRVIMAEGSSGPPKRRKVDDEDSEDDSDDDFEPSLLVKAVIAKASTFPDMNEVPTERTESDEEGIGEFDDFEMPPRDEPLEPIPPLRPDKNVPKQTEGNKDHSLVERSDESPETSKKK